MAKKYRVLNIDLNEWCTQQEKAEATGDNLSTISRRVKRTKENDTQSPIEIFDIPELNITLVRR